MTREKAHTHLRSRPSSSKSPGERGATLPEMLIALVISAGAIGLIGSAAYQLFVASKLGSARLTALHNLQNATLWLNRDVNQSGAFAPGSGSVYGTFTTGDDSVEYRYSYDPAEDALLREHLVDGIPEGTLRVARGIRDQSDVAFSVNGSLVTVAITASGPDGAHAESTVLNSAMRIR